MTQRAHSKPGRLLLPPHSTVSGIGVHLRGETSDWIQATRPYVTENELAKSKQFIHAMDATRHLVGRAVVRKAIQNTTGQCPATDVTLTPAGKPHLPQNDLCFSISHSGAMVWVAFCYSAPVGIDVENIRPLPDIMNMSTLLHPAEVAYLHDAPPESRLECFYRCWTRKEAVLKALGLGLSLPLNSFRVEMTPQKTDWLGEPPAVSPDTAEWSPSKNSHPPEQDSGGWTTYDIFSGSDYQCSLAALGTGLTLQINCFEDPAFLL